MYIYINLYICIYPHTCNIIYIYVSVCVCVCVYTYTRIYYIKVYYKPLCNYKQVQHQC